MFAKWTPADVNADKRAACSAKAKKIKNAKKRKAALKKCKKRYPVKLGSSTTTAGAALTGVTPFQSASCATGSRSFSVTVQFLNSADAKLDDTVVCTV